MIDAISDLKLIDELLLLYKNSLQCSIADLEYGPKSTVDTREAVGRLRQTWASGEMSEITLSWSRYFRENIQGKNNMTPKFKHDCIQCEFKGTFGRLKHDVYVCRNVDRLRPAHDTILVRFGTRIDQDYWSMSRSTFERMVENKDKCFDNMTFREYITTKGGQESPMAAALEAYDQGLLK